MSCQQLLADLQVVGDRDEDKGNYMHHPQAVMTRFRKCDVTGLRQNLMLLHAFAKAPSKEPSPSTCVSVSSWVQGRVFAICECHKASRAKALRQFTTPAGTHLRRGRADHECVGNVWPLLQLCPACNPHLIFSILPLHRALFGLLASVA